MTFNGKQAPDWQGTMLRNTRRLALWTCLWLLTVALMRLGPVHLWQEDKLITLAAIGLNLLVGAAMIAANIAHLKGMDELQQRIQLNAMGIALGTGLVLGLALANMADTGGLIERAEIRDLVVIMALVYLCALLHGVWKYR